MAHTETVRTARGEALRETATARPKRESIVLRRVRVKGRRGNEVLLAREVVGRERGKNACSEKLRGQSTFRPRPGVPPAVPSFAFAESQPFFDSFLSREAAESV